MLIYLILGHFLLVAHDLHFVFLLEPCFPVEVVCHFCVHTVGQVVLLPNGYSSISSPHALQKLAIIKETESVPLP